MMRTCVECGAEQGKCMPHDCGCKDPVCVEAGMARIRKWAEEQASK